MTVAYTIGKGAAWEELRYSIRSFVKNTSVDRIIIVGYKPDWLVHVEHIPFEDGPRKQLNIHLKTLAACDVCDEFIQAADDHFVLKPTDFSTYYFNGLLKDKKFEGKYATVLDNTLKLIPKGKYYNLHIPMRMNSDCYKEVMKCVDWNKDYLIKSLYANSFPAKEIQDVKVSHFMRRDAINKFVADKGFLSVSDAGLSVDMRRYLKENFQGKSIYEK